MRYSRPSDESVRRVVDRWEKEDFTSRRELRRFSRLLRTRVTTNERASICNITSEILSDAFCQLNIKNEVASGGVFLCSELMPHTWVVISSEGLYLGESGPLLIDPTVLQFFDGEALVQCDKECPFDTDVAVLSTDDFRWKRYYGLRGESRFTVPNENRDDLRTP